MYLGTKARVGPRARNDGFCYKARMLIAMTRKHTLLTRFVCKLLLLLLLLPQEN